MGLYSKEKGALLLLHTHKKKKSVFSVIPTLNRIGNWRLLGLLVAFDTQHLGNLQCWGKKSPLRGRVVIPTLHLGGRADPITAAQTLPESTTTNPEMREETACQESGQPILFAHVSVKIEGIAELN